MKISVLNEQEKAATGFTHKAIIAYNPVAALNDFTAAATTQTYTLATLASGSYIGSDGANQTATPVTTTATPQPITLQITARP